MRCAFRGCVQDGLVIGDHKTEKKTEQSWVRCFPAIWSDGEDRND